MTKADIVEIVHRKTGFNKKESFDLVESVFEAMKETLAGGEDLKLSGFGIFKVRQKADRRGRNPQTGEALTIEARRILSFKPSHVLKISLNK